jgi:hypothetical protein
MNKIILVAISAFLLSQPALAATKFKCWKNNEGVKECGTYVPAEFSQKRIETRGESGRVVEVKERAKTPEEIKEADRLAKIKKSEDEKLAIQKEKDSILLKTFSRELDITMLRDSKIKVIEGIVTVINSNNKALEKKLIKLKKQGGEKPSENVLKDIETVQSSITKNNSMIKSKQEEQELIRKAFEDDLQHFRALKNK